MSQSHPPEVTPPSGHYQACPCRPSWFSLLSSAGPSATLTWACLAQSVLLTWAVRICDHQSHLSSVGCHVSGHCAGFRAGTPPSSMPWIGEPNKPRPPTHPSPPSCLIFCPTLTAARNHILVLSRTFMRAGPWSAHVALDQSPVPRE